MLISQSCYFVLLGEAADVEELGKFLPPPVQAANRAKVCFRQIYLFIHCQI